MSARNPIAIATLALSGTTPEEDSADVIITLALDRARYQAEALMMQFDGDNRNYTLASALASQLEALTQFVGDFTSVSFKTGVEGSAEP